MTSNVFVKKSIAPGCNSGLMDAEATVAAQGTERGDPAGTAEPGSELTDAIKRDGTGGALRPQTTHPIR